MIEIKNMCKFYDKKEALHNINLTINDGEIYGVIGLSGAGKSTLIRTINMLEKPTKGQIIIDDVDLTKLKEKELLEVRKKIGMIFQNYNLIEQKTILKNVCFPLELDHVKKEDAIKKAKELLDLVGLKNRYDSYPSQLSGGEKQRVAIARAIARSPKYLLCDEATSALDPQNTLVILNLLKKINKKFKTTIIIITHEMKVVEEVCEKVAVIDKSQIAEVGLVSEVFRNPKTKITHDLVVKDHFKKHDGCKGKLIRVTFDGLSSKEPVISSMILDTNIQVNILFADTESVQGNLYGHMIIELPSSKQDEKKIIKWLKDHNMSYTEEVE